MSNKEEMENAKQETALYTQTIGYDDIDLVSWEGRGANGRALGIIELTTRIPYAPGNVNNASTFNFPVRYESLGEIDPHWVVSSEPHPEVIKRSIAAAQHLEMLGCRAVMGNCGFFGNYQPFVAEELTVPFFGSSLMQIPLAQASLGKDQRVGVLTADGSQLKGSPALEYSGVTDPDRVVIYGVENEPEVSGNHLAVTGRLNLKKFEQDLVNVASQMMKENPDIGILILECTEFEVHAHVLQNLVRRPVWGFTTLAYWIFEGLVRKPYSGWM